MELTKCVTEQPGCFAEESQMNDTAGSFVLV